MFHAPTTQGMGAFRTPGELNSCEGDPASHFSFGLGFFFNAGLFRCSRLLHQMLTTALSPTARRR